jgi:sugar lactone lactonase YvrE
MKIHLTAVLLALVMAVTTPAAGPSVWTVDSRSEVLRGDSKGVSIDDDGTITLAPKLTEVFKTEQAYIWSSAVDAGGNVYLGTGGDGKIFKLNASGAGSLFTDLSEMNVTALAIGRAGEIFAGTSPDGKVYSIDTAGKATVYFEPKEKYIWSLAVLPDGSLAVGTGDGGRIYKVRAANAAREISLTFDTSESHIISLIADKQGNLVAGTDSNGLVMRFGADGKPFGLLDSPLREIHSIAVGPDGSVYVLALGESVSKPPEAAAAATPAPESKTVTAAKANTPDAPAKSRYDLTSAKSAVYRILPDGSSDLLWASTSVTAFSLYAHQTGNGVLIGTADKGRIYNISNDGRETLVLQTDANQISTIRSAGQSLIATSSNPGSIYRIGPEMTTEGTYDSSVLDAKATAAWGRIWWRSSGSVSIQTRSGNTESPDETWSGWSTPLSDQKGSQISSPKARYFQWRATLKPSSTAVSLSEVNVAFVARNIAPEVLSIQVLPTNVGLAANPPAPVDPNIELTGLDPALFGIPNVSAPPRRIYQRGARSLQWTAEDRNGDKLVYDVLFREVNDTAFKPLREGLTDNFFTIDGQSLADGRYLFKVVARDTPSNPSSIALSGERTTEAVDIDNTPPVVTASGTPQITGDKARVTFDAVDVSSYLTSAEYSVNGGEWINVYADDGISDSPRERYTVEVPVTKPGEYAVTLRVFDVNGNSGNARTTVRR